MSIFEVTIKLRVRSDDDEVAVPDSVEVTVDPVW